jgi:hypothetical protein
LTGVDGCKLWASRTIDQKISCDIAKAALLRLGDQGQQRIGVKLRIAAADQDQIALQGLAPDPPGDRYLGLEAVLRAEPFEGIKRGRQFRHRGRGESGVGLVLVHELAAVEVDNHPAGNA